MIWNQWYHIWDEPSKSPTICLTHNSCLRDSRRSLYVTRPLWREDELEVFKQNGLRLDRFKFVKNRLNKVSVPHMPMIFPVNQHTAVRENQGKLSYVIAFTSVSKWLTAFIFSLWHLQIMGYLGTGISTARACQEYYHWRLSKNIVIPHNTSTS